MRNISSRVRAPDDVANDLLKAYSIGEEHFRQFIQDRLVAGSVPFHDRLPCRNLKTFSFLDKSASLKVKGRNVLMKVDRNFFAMMLVVAQKRAMDLRHVFQLSLGPVPWSLATSDGNIAKSPKAKLLGALESDVPPAIEVPNDAAWIIDAMALLQSLTTVP